MWNILFGGLLSAFSANRRIVFSNAVGSHFTLFWPGRCPAWKNPESCWRRTPRESKQLGTGDWEVVTPQNLRSKCQSIRRKSGWDSVNSKGEKIRSCFLQTFMVSMTQCCDFWRSPLPSLPVTPGCMVGSRRGLRRAQSSWNVDFFDLTARHHVQGASWWLFCTNSWVEFHDWSPKKGDPHCENQFLGPIFGSDFDRQMIFWPLQRLLETLSRWQLSCGLVGLVWKTRHKLGEDQKVRMWLIMTVIGQH